MEIRRCIACGKILSGRNKLYCNQACRVQYLRNKRTCIICGKEFWASPSSEVVTCSIECERKNRVYKGKKTPEIVQGLQKAHVAAKESQNTGPFETNHSAKSWIIKDPDGKRYEINNLALWARENEKILPGTIRQFCDGIRGIKQSVEGRKKRGAYQYKGWTLETYYEENMARKDIPESKPRKKRTKMTEEERLEKKRKRAREYYRKRKNDYHL